MKKIAFLLQASSIIVNAKPTPPSNNWPNFPPFPAPSAFPVPPTWGEFPATPAWGEFPAPLAWGEFPATPAWGEFPGMPGMPSLPAGKPGTSEQSQCSNGKCTKTVCDQNGCKTVKSASPAAAPSTPLPSGKPKPTASTKPTTSSGWPPAGGEFPAPPTWGEFPGMPNIPGMPSLPTGKPGTSGQSQCSNGKCTKTVCDQNGCKTTKSASPAAAPSTPLPSGKPKLTASTKPSTSNGWPPARAANPDPPAWGAFSDMPSLPAGKPGTSTQSQCSNGKCTETVCDKNGCKTTKS
eukprot:Pgem_evm1s11520